jgi:prenyltransferase beta subunit
MHLVRRIFRRILTIIHLPLQVNSQRSAIRESPKFLTELRKSTLDYVSKNHCDGEGIGSYAFKADGPSLLYASCYAVLTRHLFADLDQLSIADKSQWAEFIQKYQSSDGLFRDPLIDCQLAEDADWWGWRHMTVHALMALTAVDSVAKIQFRILEPFKKRGGMTDWLEKRTWEVSAADVSNEIQNYGTMLQYARDFQKEQWANNALDEMYEWLDRRQDKETGLWGTRFDTPYYLSQGVQTGFHIWMLYFYDKRNIQYKERIIDSCLKSQNRLGGFGVAMNSSSCEDIDSLDPLARLYYEVDYRRSDIRDAFEKALPWVLVNQNHDGGWVFRKYQNFQYGHTLMSVGPRESSMFPTWFRSLSIAYVYQILDNPRNEHFKWHFLDCPGLQFFQLSNKSGEKL